MFSTSCARISLPKRETVARAPSTTSIFMRKMKNRITAVEHPKNPQKIFRANASRNVSRTSASVAIPVLLPIHGSHEDFFQRTVSARHGLDLAFFSAQQIDRAIGHLAVGEEECHRPILGADAACLRAQLVNQAIRRMLGFHSIAAAGREVLDLPFERQLASVNN